MQLSENFWLSEFLHSQTAGRDPELLAKQNNPAPEIIENLRYLCANSVQPLRTLLKTPIRVSSGYRCDELNKRIGGSKNSQHRYGQAADLILSDRILHDSRLRRYKEVIENMVYEQVGKSLRKDVNPNFYLFAAACLYLNELDVDQLIHEYGNKGQPGWVHISSSTEKSKRQILILPDRATLTLEEALELGC